MSVLSTRIPDFCIIVSILGFFGSRLPGWAVGFDVTSFFREMLSDPWGKWRTEGGRVRVIPFGFPV